MFEEYLKEKHAKDYTGTDDEMGEHFDNWLVELMVGEWIELGDKYGEQFKGGEKGELPKLPSLSELIKG